MKKLIRPDFLIVSSNRSLLVWLLAALMTLAPAGLLAADRMEDLLDQLQNTYDKTAAYSARFEQRTGSANSREPRVAKGKVNFAKPGRMRWDYSEPAKAFISDGKTFWMVQPDRREVLEMPAEQAFGSRTPMMFLTGIGKIRGEFEPQLISDKEGLATMRLTLKKPTTQAQYLLLEMDTVSGLAKSVKTVDFFGAYNELTFTDYKLDETFADGFFTYTPPKEYKLLKPAEHLPETTTSGQ